MDEKTKTTALDAFSCKLSACKQGYITSPFTDAMKSHLETPAARFQKRSAMMHRGYYARVKSQEQTIEKFLEITSESAEGRQIVFLGSGYDPLGIEIIQAHRRSLRIFEVDFPDVIRKKADIYRKVPSIYNLLVEVAQENSLFLAPAVPSSSFRKLAEEDSPVLEDLGAVQLFGCDMRRVDALQGLFQGSNSLFSPVAPTLFITECVLVYMTADESASLISVFSDILLAPATPALWISYDMIHPEDIYGQMMLKNLRRAGYLLPGFEACPTPDAQCRRFLSHISWTEAHSQDMLFIYQNILDEAEKDRISHLEIMDEVEEWNILMGHYTLTIASRVPVVSSDEEEFKEGAVHNHFYSEFRQMTRAMTVFDPSLHPRVRSVEFPTRK